MPRHRTWRENAGVPVGLYIFCDGSGTGTLEDCIESALVKHVDVMKVTESYLRTNHIDLPFTVVEGGDEVAARAKTHKAKFTVLGQREKALAGSSLAVTLRKSSMLNDAFDFEGEGFVVQIMQIMENAFSCHVSDTIETIATTPITPILLNEEAATLPING
jgi:hypothetical protein